MVLPGDSGALKQSAQMHNVGKRFSAQAEMRGAETFGQGLQSGAAGLVDNYYRGQQLQQHILTQQLKRAEADQRLLETQQRMMFASQLQDVKRKSLENQSIHWDNAAKQSALELNEAMRRQESMNQPGMQELESQRMLRQLSEPVWKDEKWQRRLPDGTWEEDPLFSLTEKEKIAEWEKQQATAEYYGRRDRYPWDMPWDDETDQTEVAGPASPNAMTSATQGAERVYREAGDFQEERRLKRPAAQVLKKLVSEKPALKELIKSQGGMDSAAEAVAREAARLKAEFAAEGLSFSDEDLIVGATAILEDSLPVSEFLKDTETFEHRGQRAAEQLPQRPQEGSVPMPTEADVQAAEDWEKKYVTSPEAKKANAKAKKKASKK